MIRCLGNLAVGRIERGSGVVRRLIDAILDKQGKSESPSRSRQAREKNASSREKKKVRRCVSVASAITPEKVKKWYYNQVAIDRTLLPLLLLQLRFFSLALRLSKMSKHNQGWQDQQNEWS